MIIEGRVSGIRTRKDETTGLIWTIASIQVSDVLSGTVDSAIDLEFLGGTFQGVTLSVPKMQVPRLHETGIYFVRSLDTKQVHPLTGWTQGHFIIHVSADGQRQVLTFDGRPVIAIEEPVGIARRRLSSGVARGIRTTTSSSIGSAMQISAFKDHVRYLVY